MRGTVGVLLAAAVAVLLAAAPARAQPSPAQRGPDGSGAAATFYGRDAAFWMQRQQEAEAEPIDVRTCGSSPNLREYLAGFLTWVRRVTPPYPPLPPGAGPLPPLPPEREGDVAWVRALPRGPWPSVVKGRPTAYTPQVTDPLQNGRDASLAPGPAWVSRLPIRAGRHGP
ncbi:hypothetical protein Rsub_08486 [Raphidocelis subcapitata]|uniref:Uncharacterized protein n=1 Tax=Raphidocelis subcapitata TaxID=307507 RepID=A0A2V0PFQ9_9CHLO|nr:hypothetical protein Rsub_08486 [Raphidocelis subcapitata]|eukprot:GBF95895.1 hypothetical protein Rsub_08486 [Raphidocelis subcapitata]